MWFVRRKSPSVEGLSVADLQRLEREKIRLTQAEKRLTGKVEQLEAAKAAAFQQGAGCLSDRQRMQFARKFKELDQQIVACDQQLALVGRNLRTLAALDRLSETGQVASNCSVGALLDSLDLTALSEQLDRAAAERDVNQLRLDRLASVLTPQRFGETTGETASGDDELTAIVRAMAAAAPTVVPDRSPGAPDSKSVIRQAESKP